MTTRSSELAQRFAVLNQTLIGIVEGCSPVQWQALCPDEERTVGVLAHHVGTSYPFLINLARAAALGRPGSSLNTAIINQTNAEHARAHAHAGKDETLTLLRSNGAEAVEIIRSFSDEQLDRVLTGDVPVTTQQVIEVILMSHIRSHQDSILAAMGRV